MAEYSSFLRGWYNMYLGSFAGFVVVGYLDFVMIFRFRLGLFGEFVFSMSLSFWLWFSGFWLWLGLVVDSCVWVGRWLGCGFCL